MPPQHRIFSPSARTLPTGTRLGAIDPEARIEISLYLKPRRPAEAERGHGRADLREMRQREHAHGMTLIDAFAKEYGLDVLDRAPERHLVRLGGTAAAMQRAFATELHVYSHKGRQFRARSGALSLPDALHSVVEAVLGLDNRPQAEAHFRPAAQGTGFLPNQLGRIYQFPAGDGAGQTIGLIELGGGYLDSDVAAAFGAMGLTAPNVVAVGVDGGTNAPIPDDGADTEVALDIQVAGGNAPAARIAVYFAPNTDAGFADAISQAVHDSTRAPSVLSISWGSAEVNWTAQAVAAMNNALNDAVTLGVSVFVAAGDNLATDGVNDGAVHVDFPASSPYAIGCGGTNLTASGDGIVAEVVWNDGTSGTGGGISALSPAPHFQAGVMLPPNASTGGSGRGVPDVCGNAAPGTGYAVVVNGTTQVVGGTSAVAPLWAGLVARINAASGKPAGFFLPALYAAANRLNDITEGNNIPAGTSLGYRAGPGWDACTGLGSPNGGGLAALFGLAVS